MARTQTKVSTHDTMTLDPEAFRDPVSHSEGFYDSAANHIAEGHGGKEFAQLRERIQMLERDAAGNAAGGDVTAPVTSRRSKNRQAKETTMNTSAATTTGQPQAPSSNAPSFESLRTIARDLGTQRGQGKDTQIKFGLKVIEAAYLGALDLDPNKHGKDVRDGHILAQDYMQAANKAVIFDAKADNVRKLVSNLDKCIKLGSNPKWGNGQPLQNVNELMTLRQNEKKLGKKVDDAFNTLMRYATQQLKKDTLIDGDDLKEFVYKKDPALRDASEVLEAIRKMAQKLKTGKVSNCPDMDDSNEVGAIINACTKRLTAIAKAKGGNTQAAQPATPAAA